MTQSTSTSTTTTTTTSTTTPITSTLPLSPNTQNQTSDQHQYIWLLTGPAGCGKSTLGKYLSNTLKLPYVEGDEFHPKASVEKMACGIPLMDADRWDWLISLREASLHHLAAGHDGVVVTCSALKRKYRDVIRVASYHSQQKIRVHFFYLDAPEHVLQARVKARKDHYMGANMVHSQFNILEPPDMNESDVCRINVSRPLEQVQEEVLAKVLNTRQN